MRQKQAIIIGCQNCGGKLKGKYSVKFCSHKCSCKFRTGQNHWHWKGGIRKRSDGYLRNTHDEYIHRLVMERFLGRKLLSSEHIHHIDGNPENNTIENLLLVSNSQHRKIECKNAKRNSKGRFA